MLITVFTPTFDRKEELYRLYKSLLAQSEKNFEWIIVDDGSKDNTEKFVEKWINDNLIRIKFLKVFNGGKHRAINIGVSNAKGEFFFIVDSDDYLEQDAIKKISHEVKNLPENIKGVVGLKVFEDGTVVGTTHKYDFVDCLYKDRKKHNIIGDKAEVVRTDIMRKYKFPEIKNEKFISEGIVWNRMSFDGIKLRYINEKLYFCEYLENGLTSNIDKIYAKNPIGYLLYIQEAKKQLNLFSNIKNEIAYSYRLNKAKYNVQRISKDLRKSELIIYGYVMIGKIFSIYKRKLR